MKPISRRTVAKGIAWTAPVVAIAGTAPAYATSGPKPTLTYNGACKFPGSKCDGRVFQGYGLVFDVKNNDPDKAIYFCTPKLTEILPADSFGGKQPTWVKPADGSGCVKVGAGGTGKLYFFITDTGNSQNTQITATLTVQWGHTCPCSNDPMHVNQPIVQQVNIDETPPHGDCQCDSDYVSA